MRNVKTALLLVIPAWLFAASPDATSIVRRSAEVLKADWQAEPAYNYSERDQDGKTSKTWQVMMILGSPYRRLTAIDGKQLPPEDQEKEERKLKAAVAQRCAESAGQKQERIRKYQKDQDRDHHLTEQLTAAFTFKIIGKQRRRGHMTWVLSASPKPGYQPADEQTEVLTGMEGKLWVDQATFQWVRVEAFVIHPVSIDGFLAQVEPGTEFELEKEPVPGGVWFPSHFSVRSKAQILGFIRHGTHDDETYFKYQKADQAETPGCAVNSSAKRP